MSGIYNDDEIIEKDTDTEEKEDKAEKILFPLPQTGEQGRPYDRASE